MSSNNRFVDDLSRPTKTKYTWLKYTLVLLGLLYPYYILTQVLNNNFSWIIIGCIVLYVLYILISSIVYKSKNITYHMLYYTIKQRYLQECSRKFDADVAFQSELLAFVNREYPQTRTRTRTRKPKGVNTNNK